MTYWSPEGYIKIFRNKYVKYLDIISVLLYNIVFSLLAIIVNQKGVPI